MSGKMEGVCRCILGWTEKNYENVIEDGKSPNRDQNRVPWEWKSRTLPL
jgi:hypothetical protein